MKKFLCRAMVGLLLIYGINQFLLSEEIVLGVGINVWTFLTTGFLGIPGVALLYGIMILQIL